MEEKILIGLVGIFFLGAAAQWLAWRVRIPSILLLLIFGILAGPVGGLINPDELLNHLLFPVVSLSVAIILFEGGLTLRFNELRTIGRVVWKLISLGAVITWILGAVAAHYLIGLSWAISLLLGAVLVVSGPTVVQPLLRHLRPTGRVGPILKWEAIIIDPLGATLALLVFEALTASSPNQITDRAFIVIIKTLSLGIFGGAAGAGLVILLLRRYWIPDYLENAVTTTVVLVAFAVSNHFQSESGLLTVTVLGMVLANQHFISIKRIVEFKENLRVVLISTLFIILAARIELNSLYQLSAGAFAFLGILILLVRPLSVMLCTIGSDLSRNERIFLSWVMPRGIVAAAVSAIFALRLAESGYPGAELLVPLTFMVIFGTVTIYGLTAPLLAWRLKVANPNPQGALIVGAHPLGRAISETLQNKGFPVLLLDTNYDNVRHARMAGLPATYANVLSDYALGDLELGGIGRLLAITSNDEVNSLAIMHFSELFERSELYQLSMPAERETKRAAVSRELRGRILFGENITYPKLADRINKGAVIKSTVLTETFTRETFQEMYGESALPLFVITDTGKLLVLTAGNPPTSKKGYSIIYLVNPAEVPTDKAKEALESKKPRQLQQ